MLDLSLYLVANFHHLSTQDFLVRVQRALSAGVRVVQFRAPQCDPHTQILLAHELRALTLAHHVAFLINDDVDLCLRVHADGVHLGQDDMPAADARKILGHSAIIGLSVGSLDELEASRSCLDCVDYLGIGPVFGTVTKSDAGGAIGLDAMAQIGHQSGKPYVGIGGIDLRNAQSVISAGADGVAVVSAVMNAPDPYLAAQQLTALVSSF